MVQSQEEELYESDIMNFNNLNESVVSLIHLKNDIIAAGEFGRIVKIPLVKRKPEINIKKHQILKTPDFRFQIEKEILKIDKNTFLNFYTYGDENGETIISLMKDKDEEIILKTKKPVYNIQIDDKFSKLCVSGSSTCILMKNKKKWETIFMKNTPIKGSVFLKGGSIIGVILQETKWLELWKMDTGLPVLTSIKLPETPSCIVLMIIK